jgi:hypothetical protein
MYQHLWDIQNYLSARCSLEFSFFPRMFLRDLGSPNIVEYSVFNLDTKKCPTMARDIQN